MDSKLFYEILFDKDEYTCFTDTLNTKVTSVHARRNGVKEDKQFFCINPIQPNKSRLTSNVVVFRNILVEIDKDEQGNDVDRIKQKKMYDRVGLPYATLVWSGSKSYHAIISLNEPFEDVAEYRRAVEAVYKVLKQSNIPNDSGVKDPARWSRSAESVRINTRQIQEIEVLRNRISRKQFEDWLASHDVEMEAPLYNDHGVSYTSTSDASIELKRDWVMKYYMKNMQYVQGNKNNYQFTYARLLRATGMTKDEVYQVFLQQFDLIDERDPIGSAFSANYNSDQKIYVPSMEERRQYYKQLEDSEKLNLLTEDTINFVVDREQHIQGEALNEYILVDNDFFWVDPIDWSRRKRTDRAIRARFPGVRLHEIVTEDRVFKGFKYEPDYLNYQRNIEGYYNTFEPFKFQPVKGQWPTIKQHLQHLFGGVRKYEGDYENQYLEIIEWLRVSLHHPKHPLWAIVLTSKDHGVGKNIFAIILKAIFGANYSSIRRTDIENDRFNSAFAETQLCFIDEFEKVKDPVRAYGMFKEMVTATEGIRVEKKGLDSYEVDMYAKFVFAHNASEIGFPGIESSDRRFWIRDIQKPVFEMNDGYVDRIRQEIPHLVWDLLYETPPLYDRSHGALWIPAEATWTIWLDNAKENNKSYFYHTLKAEFEHYFQDHDEDVIYTTARSLSVRLNNDEIRKITNCLTNEFRAHQDTKVTRRKDFITGQSPKNGTKWFHITRQMIYGKSDNDNLEVQLAADYFDV